MPTAFDCLLTQSETDWEAVVVDDGSTDETGAIIARYAARDSRFKALSGLGEGAAMARNRGLAAAKGRWLMFLDADDWVDPDYLRKMLGALAADPGASAVCCGFQRVMQEGRLSRPYLPGSAMEDPQATFARTCAVVTVNTVMIDREAVVRLGGFDRSLATCEDWDLWQRLTAAGVRWAVLNEPLSYYRTTLNSLSSNRDQMIRDSREVIGRGFARLRQAGGSGKDLSEEEAQKQAALAHAYVVLWCIVSDRCRGGSQDYDATPLKALPTGHEEAGFIADTIVEAIMVGCAITLDQLAANWPRYGSATSDVITALGRVWNDAPAARRVQYALEELVLDYDDLAEPRALALTLGLRVDACAPKETAIAPGMDRVYSYLVDGEEILALEQRAALGTIVPHQWIAAAGPFVSSKRFLKRTPGAWPMVAYLLARRTARRLLNGRLPVPRRMDVGAAVRSVRHGLLHDARRARPAPGSHLDQLRRIEEAVRKDLARRPPAPIPAATAAAASTPKEPERGGDRSVFWEDYFSVEDPWHYGSPYEQEKYQHQIDLLPEGAIGRALELACAEGFFTVRLAPRVEHLLATDISAKALERARSRVGPKDNVDFQVLDLSADMLPSGLNLLVCSEVLYYLDDEDELRHIARRIADALAPGGHLLTCHAHVLKDDRNRTGFDWGNPFGVKVISKVFQEAPGLVLERSLETELYRVDRFRRIDAAAAIEPVSAPVVETVSVRAPLGPDVAGAIVWNGAVATRAEVQDEKRYTIPVLMYHGICEDGPEALARYRTAPAQFDAQMNWLRRHGYYTMGSAELAWYLESNEPFVGRPVIVTFDDGLKSFADNGWPILKRYGFIAEMFVVTGKAGQTADWDAHYGAPAPLMDVADLVRLAGEGVRFGSHLDTHRAVDTLSSRELAEELLRSKVALETWLGSAPTSFAAPFSIVDGRLKSLAQECGYQIGFGDGTGAVGLGADSLNLPRIEIRGDWTLDVFAKVMNGQLQ